MQTCFPMMSVPQIGHQYLIVQILMLLLNVLISGLEPWKRVRVHVQSAPWITSEFMSLREARGYHCHQYSKCPCEHHQAIKKEAQ